MKLEKLIEEKELLLIEKDLLDIATSKVERDEGFVPWVMRSNKKKIMARLVEIELKLNKPEPVKKEPIVKKPPVVKKSKVVDKKD